MKGLFVCLLVVVAVTAVRSQGPPTQTRKGTRPARRNDNTDVGLPSGADVPDGRRLAPARAAPRPAARRPAARPAARPARRPAARPALPVPAAQPVIRYAAAPPARRPGVTRTRSGARPLRRNDNPDFGLPSGRDYPDAGFAAPAPAPVAPAGPAYFYQPAAPAAPAASAPYMPPAAPAAPAPYMPPAAPAPYMPPAAPAPYMPPAAPAVPAAPAAPAFTCEMLCRYKSYKPVCSIFGNEFENDCLRECYGEIRDCENPCPCNAPAPAPAADPMYPTWGTCDHCFAEEGDPVCVDDEQTYQNECFARCEGHTKFCSSTCPCYQ